MFSLLIYLKFIARSGEWVGRSIKAGLFYLAVLPFSTLILLTSARDEKRMGNDLCGVLWSWPQCNTYLFHIRCTIRTQSYDHTSLHTGAIFRKLTSVMCSMVLYDFIMLCSVSTIHPHNCFHTVILKFCAEQVITAQSHVRHGLITTVVLSVVWLWHCHISPACDHAKVFLWLS